MKKFTKLTSIAAPLLITNIDTDMIIPAPFLKTTKRTGLGKNLFNKFRYDNKGNTITDFILNKEPYDKAEILIAGENFGCGSSREHAPWALLDFGIRCIIAPSFADIFYNNSFKNGLLLVKLSKQDIDILINDANNKNPITVDLENQKITSSSGIDIKFDIEPFRKNCLLNGLDDIDLTLKKVDLIKSFEEQQELSQPWL
jgi:3-isopropylmalate/(R)-2-methylmalate dehydratase small subunit